MNCKMGGELWALDIPLVSVVCVLRLNCNIIMRRKRVWRSVHERNKYMYTYTSNVVVQVNTILEKAYMYFHKATSLSPIQ